MVVIAMKKSPILTSGETCWNSSYTAPFLHRPLSNISSLSLDSSAKCHSSHPLTTVKIIGVIIIIIIISHDHLSLFLFFFFSDFLPLMIHTSSVKLVS